MTPTSETDTVAPRRPFFIVRYDEGQNAHPNPQERAECVFDFDAGTWVEGRTRDQSGSPAPPVPAEQSLIAQDLRTMEAMRKQLYTLLNMFSAHVL